VRDTYLYQHVRKATRYRSDNQPTDIDWDLELATGDIENLWNRFADRLSNNYKEFIPVSDSMPKRFDTPWMNKETLAAIILKRRLWKYKYCRNQRNIERYEEAKRRSKYLVRGAKEEYERSIALNLPQYPCCSIRVTDIKIDK
jgi:hypothetical protein